MVHANSQQAGAGTAVGRFTGENRRKLAFTYPSTMELIIRGTGEGGPRVIGPKDGKTIDLVNIGVRYLAWKNETGGGFSAVEHPIPPRTLVAPLHRHQNEDEYSFVLEGSMGAQLGEDVVVAHVGDFVFKPRQQWHSFWNAGDTPCRILEIISPGGFERFFDEYHTALNDAESKERDVAAMTELNERYEIEFKPESVDELCKRHGLRYEHLSAV